MSADIPFLYGKSSAFCGMGAALGGGVAVGEGVGTCLADSAVTDSCALSANAPRDEPDMTSTNATQNTVGMSVAFIGCKHAVRSFTPRILSRERAGTQALQGPLAPIASVRVAL